MTRPAPLRCAIYTRKSSEEGLEQDFNSLHAQREACEAYILSQAGEGWTCLPNAYDDGGISGGTMERPGLKQLLADIEARRIDVVVVYKVDRLTRSLGDFGRMVEIFDRHGVSFVSVTQAFNTTNSMGRLTLNVLLSFAQFEREVTGERIRDKIAASKKKGLWMGGVVPLGYVADGRTLKINEAEAETVRHIFARYLELKSVHVLQRELATQGVISKRSVFASGRVRGGTPFNRGALFALLANPLYVGKIRHKAETHEGLHKAIVDDDVFARVQALLAANSVRRTSGSRCRMQSPLVGKLFEECGAPLTPTFTTRPGGRTYRYYVSTAALTGDPHSSVRRIPGPALEQHVADLTERLIGRTGATIDKIVVTENGLELALVSGPLGDDETLHRITPNLAEGERIRRGAEGGVIVSSPIRPVFRGGRTRLIGTAPMPTTPKPDPVLVAALRRAHRIVGAGGPFDPASRAPAPRHDRRLCRLAFLAPDLQSDILQGRFPRAIALIDLIQLDLPLDWAGQRLAVQKLTNQRPSSRGQVAEEEPQALRRRRPSAYRRPGKHRPGAVRESPDIR